MSRFHVVIPARYGSTRLPGKPLREIAGEIMVAHVYARACQAGAEQTIVATDDQRVLAACQKRGIDVLLTRADHPSGSDRCAEVAALRGFAADDVVVNVQGDEPLIEPADIRAVAAALNATQSDLATLAYPIQSDAEFRDANVVKVVCDLRGRALLFSRAPIPFVRDAGGDHTLAWRSALRHIGLYAYRTQTLARQTKLPSCELEQLEKLEQLRALWNGLSIGVAVTANAPGPGVDTEADLQHVAALLGGKQ